VGHAVGRDLAVFHEDRAAEVVALEEGEALLAGELVLFLGFDFFSNEGDGDVAEPVKEAFALFGAGDGEIDFDVVGDLDEGLKAGVPDKVIEGEAEAGGLELAACLDEARGGLKGFKNLKHRHAGGQDVDEVLSEGLGGAVDEGRQAAGEAFEAVDDGVVKHGAGGKVAVAAKDRLRAGAEEQLVAVDPLAEVEDGLPRDIAHALGRLKRRGLGADGGTQLRGHAYLPELVIGWREAQL